jgi:hypothetical protein
MKNKIFLIINLIKQGYLIPLAIVCFALFTNEQCVDDPDSSTYGSIDYDSDGLTDDIEQDPTNIDLYSLDWQSYNIDPSISYGTHLAGNLVGGLSLPKKGLNYKQYVDDPGYPENYSDWGNSVLFMDLTNVARELLKWGEECYQFGEGWCSDNDDFTGDGTNSEFNGPLWIGSLSLQNGGPWDDMPFGNHQNGLEANIRYIRFSPEEWQNDIPLDIVMEPGDWGIQATKNVFYAFREYAYRFDDIVVDDIVADEIEVLRNNVSIFTVDNHFLNHHATHFTVRSKCPGDQCN